MADDAEKKPEQDVSSAKQPGLLTLVKGLAFISVIVLLEVAGASMIVPSAKETTAIAEKLAAAEAAEDFEKKDASTTENAKAEQPVSQDMREVALGSYHVLSYDPDTGSSLNVDFEVYGTVLADEESDFYQLYDVNERRIREQILITVRGAEITDLTDAGLGLIKRKILERVNRALGKPLLHETIFSTFSFIER